MSKPSILMYGDGPLSPLPLYDLFSSETVISMSSSPTHVAFACASGRAYIYGKSLYHYKWSVAAAENPSVVLNLVSVTIVQVACGFHSTYFLTDTGHLYSCGFNGSGQLGQGITGHIPSPMRVNGLQQLKKVKSGLFHVLVLTESGKVLVCGANYSGQLGLAHNRYQDSFQEVTSIGKEGADIDCGSYHSAILTKSGEILMAGRNRKYQCGIDRAHIELVTVFWRVALPWWERFVAVACGAKHTVALTETGTVWVWGSNKYGQLGTWEIEPRSTLSSYKVPGDVWKIFASGNHTVLMTKDGKVLFCGQGLSGKLDDCVKGPTCIAVPNGMVGKDVVFSHGCFLMTVTLDVEGS